MKDLQCSLVICTYNRPEKLRRCLSSLVCHDNDPFEVLVIDNSDAGNVKEVCLSFENTIPRLRYIHEPEKGLAIARNRGMHEARGEYIFYLDDDAWVEENFFSILQDVTQSNEFQAFGAYVKGYFSGDRPKWLRSEYYHPDPFLPSRGELINGFLHGGASGYRKDILLLLGGYDTSLGMRGEEVRYGEDTELEKRIRKRGLKVGYDPQLIVHHEIRYRTLSEILRSYYKRALTYYSLNEDMVHGQVIRSCFSLGFQALKSLARLFSFRKGYYVQNWFLDITFPLLRAIAVFKSAGPQYLNNKRYIYRRTSILNDILEHLGRTKKDLRFVQIGGCDGVSFDPIYSFVHRFKWRGHIVEPLPHLVTELRSNYRDLPEIEIVETALSNHDGMAEIEYLSQPSEEMPEWTKGIASLVPDRNALNPLLGLNRQWQDKTETQVVKTMSWDTFCKTFNIQPPDLLVIDIEGMEYEVLKQIKHLPPVILFEFVNLPIDELNELILRMEKNSAPRFIIQYSDNDYIALLKEHVPFLLRIKYNLPLFG